MIQRVQSIWLLLASIAAFATLKVSFYSGNMLNTVTNTKEYIALTALNNLLLLVTTVAVAVAALVVIFLYKDRKRQLLVTSATAVLSIINLAIYYIQTKKYSEGNFDLTALVALSIPVFLAAALRGIWKDEQLVKSTNRLR